MDISKRIKTGVAAFVLGTLQSCGFLYNPHDRPVLHFTITQEAKDYCAFKNGSRWVYKNRENGTTDTVSLSEYQQYTPNTSRFGFTSESINYKKKSSFLAASIPKDSVGFYAMINTNLTSKAYEEGKKYHSMSIEFYGKGAPKPSVNHAVFIADTTPGFVVPYTDLLWKGISYESRHDSLIVAGRVYRDVRVFTIPKQQYPEDCKRSYWARHVGIIKRELFDGTVWELVEYEVKK